MSSAVVIELTDASIELHRTKVVSVPRPVVGTKQGLISVNAVSLNHRDLWILKKHYNNTESNTVVGSDAVGRLKEISGESPRLKVGDRVVVMPSIGWNANQRGPEIERDYSLRGGAETEGVFKQLLSVDLDDIYRAPAHLTDIEAAALPLAGLTAYRAVFTKGQIVKGQNVLITGIGGGVALFALQYAVAVGANVYVTSSDNSKLERAIQLGAKGGANYRKDNWEEQLLKASNGQQIDVVIDGASGPGVDTILSKVLVPGGIFVTYGQTAGDFKFNIVHIIRNIEVRGSTMGSRVEFEKMLEFVERYQIRPVVSQVFEGLEKASEAFQKMKNGAQFGKLVVTVQYNEE